MSCLVIARLVGWPAAWVFFFFRCLNRALFFVTCFCGWQHALCVTPPGLRFRSAPWSFLPNLKTSADRANIELRSSVGARVARPVSVPAFKKKYVADWPPHGPP